MAEYMQAIDDDVSDCNGGAKKYDQLQDVFKFEEASKPALALAAVHFLVIRFPTMLRVSSTSSYTVSWRSPNTGKIHRLLGRGKSWIMT